MEQLENTSANMVKGAVSRQLAPQDPLQHTSLRFPLNNPTAAQGVPMGLNVPLAQPAPSATSSKGKDDSFLFLP